MVLSLVQLIISLTKYKFGVAFLDDLLFKSSIHSGAFAMLLGLVIVPVVSLLTPKPDKQKVDEMFSCYQQKISVPVKDSLGE